MFSDGISGPGDRIQRGGKIAKIDSLTALNVNTGVAFPVRFTNTTPNTLTDADFLLQVNANGFAITVNLPTAAGRAGRIFVIKKTDTTANTITIDAAGSETIDDATTYVMTATLESVVLMSDGGNWYIIAAYKE